MNSKKPDAQLSLAELKAKYSNDIDTAVMQPASPLPEKSIPDMSQAIENDIKVPSYTLIEKSGEVKTVPTTFKGRFDEAQLAGKAYADILSARGALKSAQERTEAKERSQIRGK